MIFVNCGWKLSDVKTPIYCKLPEIW